MSSTFHGKSAAVGQSFRSDLDDNHAPPSTLAAQLVENISTSSKSSRSDENGEIKRLSAAIERVKSNPGFLQTAEHRIEHHHTLIYVVSRAVLDSLRLDDPFLDKDRLRANALKAIHCLKVTIVETPSVLAYTAKNGSFLFRGGEPLWAWVLPKLLRFLGHPECSGIWDSLGNLCETILRTISQDVQLRPTLPSLLSYMRTTVSDIIHAVCDSSIVPGSRNAAMTLDLPTEKTLSELCTDNNTLARRHVTYRLTSPPQCLQQGLILLSILESFFKESSDLGVSELGPWLLDSAQALCTAQIRWDPPIEVEIVPLIRIVLNVASQDLSGTRPACFLLEKACVCLTFLIPELANRPAELLGDGERRQLARTTLCSAIIVLTKASMEHRPIGRLVTAQVVDICEYLSHQVAELGSGTDFLRSIVLLKDASSIFDVPRAFDPQSRPDSFEDPTLRQQVQWLELDYREPDTVGQKPPAKRRKVAGDAGGIEALFDELSQFLQPKDSESGGLEELLIGCFPHLDDHQQCLVIDLLARAPCAADGTLQADGLDRAGPPIFSCQFCDEPNINCLPPTCANPTAKEEAYAALENLVQLTSFRESKRPRVVGMMALRRFSMHSVEPEFLDMEVSKSALWCFQSLSSSIRELRIAAGRTLPLFLRNLEIGLISSDLPRDRASDVTAVVSRNIGNIFKQFKSLSDKAQPGLHETCIMAWGQLGRILSDQELNLVLSELIEYLGSRNNIVSALAFHELSNLAKARGVSPRKLFAPFWRSLALKVVKDVKERPHIGHAIADLLQIPAEELLLHVQSHALPWLVLQGKREVIQKIAEARGEKDLHSVILDSANIGPILAFLMSQTVEKVGEFAMAKLANISSHFADVSLSRLLVSDIVGVALELFKLAAEGDDTRKQMVRHTLAEIAHTVGIPGETRARRGNTVGRFLQSHVLGLMTRVTEVVNAAAFGRPATLEQRLCLRAMEEMIRVCKSHVRIARPQISACLLATIPLRELRQWSFSCWSAMVMSLEEEDVEVLLEPTFSLILEYWPVSNEPTRKLMENLLQYLLDGYSQTIGSNIHRIPLMGQVPGLKRYEEMLGKVRKPLDTSAEFGIFAQRIAHENSSVVFLALTELVEYLKTKQEYLQTSVISEHPDPVVSTLLRSLLDCASRHNGVNIDVARLCTESIGLIGCVDSNRIEATRAQKTMVILDNFELVEDRQHFGFFILTEVLAKSFLSATDTRRQGLLSFAMQELLERCDIKAAVLNEDGGRRGGGENPLSRKWRGLPTTVQEVLTPFLNSRYALAPMAPMTVEYPIFRPGQPYAVWLRSFVLHLIRNPQNANAALVFEPLCRVIRNRDVSVAEFLLPYAVTHIILSENTPKELRENVSVELSTILKYEVPAGATPSEKHEMKLFYEALFRTLDYIMRWVHAWRARCKNPEKLPAKEQALVDRAAAVLRATPANLVAERAVKCEQYSRALFNLEVEWSRAPAGEKVSLIKSMQDVYAHIDEPDGLEGLSVQLQVVDIDQQMLSHRKAGRWTAAQTWYEIRLAEEPDNADIQHDLLTCLKQSGQHDVLLNTVEGMQLQPATQTKIVPFAVEAAWATGRWDALAKYLDASKASSESSPDFDVAIGEVFRNLKQQGDAAHLMSTIKGIREQLAASMGISETSSLQACHDILLRCHVLTDLEIILSARGGGGDEASNKGTTDKLNRRLGVLGAYVDDKQYLLSIQRAAMELRRPNFTNLDISGLWLTSARLARKKNTTHQSFNAVLHASQLGDGMATLENAKLLWKDGHQRKAIQILRGAIKNNDFVAPQQPRPGDSMQSSRGAPLPQQLLKARTELLLAKWLDAAGQTNVATVRETYQQAAKTHGKWEKGHYYLGKHYKTYLETQKSLKPDDQSDGYVTGELAKLMIENYLRSLFYGTKYLPQTLPRIIGQWLELAAQVNKAPEGKRSISPELFKRRTEVLNKLHDIIDKWIPRLPAYVWYTALPQIVTRVTHPNARAFEKLSDIIVKVVEAHPRQALWHVFGIMATKQMGERRQRGQQVLQRLRAIPKKADNTKLVMRDFIRRGEKLAEQLLFACNNGDFPANKTVRASIVRDLQFNHAACTPSHLVMPTETHLTAQLPALTDRSRHHQAFSADTVTLESFLDEVLVLGSIARPRRLTARGSDGKNYKLLIKPKDDLRTDQRLMEFNAMINRGLKRDAESSRRQLYVRTYAVTPLNEECGIIEWVDGLKTIRDILLELYRARGVAPNYGLLKRQLDEAVSGPPEKMIIFTRDVLGQFPAVLHLWFINQFPDPTAWFSARLQYTRSCAVMSMVGTILGLGDRHGENVLIEEGNGGIFHVDFNCLFDKGTTFATPERVPFRLTHNMVSAMGVYGVEGPFRTCCELTLSVLRQQEETLMTILEAFIYDPTLDLQKEKKNAKRDPSAAKFQPQNAVDTIKRKMRGYIGEENIPLGVEGQVEELIRQATSSKNLAAMYIGWCSFL